MEELINCIEELGYTMPLNLNVNVFFNKSKRNKSDSDNKMRELIIYNLLNKKITPYSKKWVKIDNKLNGFINDNFESPLKEVVHKGGRNFKYDFLLSFENGKNVELEFKYGVNSLTKYPQIYQTRSNKFLKGESYPEYFYDHYKYFEDTPKKQFLVSVYKPHFFHKEVSKKDSLESISDYLENYLEFDFNSFKDMLKDQAKKKFMLYFNEEFYLDYLTDENININERFTLKLDRSKKYFNTIIINSVDNSAEYHLLLRIKDTAGPSWQVKFKRNKR